MPVGAVVTAADVSADLAEAKVHPLPSDLEAVFAPLGAGRNVADLGKVFTCVHFLGSFAFLQF